MKRRYLSKDEVRMMKKHASPRIRALVELMIKRTRMMDASKAVDGVQFIDLRTFARKRRKGQP